jgi:hypothetical protein
MGLKGKKHFVVASLCGLAALREIVFWPLLGTRPGIKDATSVRLARAGSPLPSARRKAPPQATDSLQRRSTNLAEVMKQVPQIILHHKPKRDRILRAESTGDFQFGGWKVGYEVR